MSDVQISVKKLEKKYRIPVRKPGLLSAFSSLFIPVYNEVKAVNNINFEIHKGEIIGFIGPNGAGKTTTLKLLTGLLYPTSGEIKVAGFIPYQRKTEFLKQISMVMGNKNQLTWENTILDSFYILKEIYGIPAVKYKENLDQLVALLNLEELLPKMARNLSLGERAKCEFAAALLHQPSLLFLDEPTLGLDVTMQIKIRDFIKEYIKKRVTTVIITSHYMADIVSLCSRVILIDKGSLHYDGNLSELAEKIAPFKLIKLSLTDNRNDINKITSKYSDQISILEHQDNSITLRVKKSSVATISTEILNNYTLVDLTIENPPIEAVIDQIYRQGIEK